MSGELSGRVALVTGAVANIGQATALELARRGAEVAVTCRGVGGTGATCAAVEAVGGKAEGFVFDLADPSDPERLAGELLARYGRVDIVVHNAAIRPVTALGEIDAASFDAVFAVNVRGPLLLTQALLPPMVEGGWGRVVFFSGISAYIGQRGRAVVAASKLAVTGVARALAFELAGSGVTVNTVVPGTIDTVRGDAARHGPASDPAHRARNVPMGRLGAVDDVAHAVAHLASDHAAYTTGQELFVAGGAFNVTREGVG